MTAIIKETGQRWGGLYGCSPTHYQMFRGHSSLYTHTYTHSFTQLSEKKQKKKKRIHSCGLILSVDSASFQGESGENAGGGKKQNVSQP